MIAPSGAAFRAALAALFICAACGSGDSAPPVTADKLKLPDILRTDLHMGYWAGNPLYLVEQADHVNVWFARADGAASWHLAIAEQLQMARGAGIRNIVLHLPTDEPVGLRFELGKLAEGGWLAGWDSITVYRWDEPNMAAGGNLSEQDLADRVTRVRQVMFDVPGMLGTKVGVFYACANGGRPAIKSFDLVGCFRYGGDGCARLEDDYAGLRALKAITARLWLIPSGADINGKEGRQEPACWHSYAQRFADVWGIIAFMWQSGADPHNSITGIRDIPAMRKLYCEMGRTILNPNEPARC